MADGPQHRGEIRRLLAEHGHRPNPVYGQNFLAEPGIVAAIVEAAGIAGRKVVEVGAGTGTLTRALVEEADVVVAYEVDRHLEPLLDEALVGLDVDVRIADASGLDWCAELGGTGWVMVANLPYNVGTGIVLDVLQTAPCVDRLVVMVQREVADRFLAEPGSKTYGIPSVVVGLHADARIAVRVPPGAFEPPPTVESAVVVLDRTAPDPDASRAIELATAAFGQRRKMLRRSLAPTFGDPAPVLERAGVDPTRRAEELTPDDYLAVAAEDRDR